MNRPAFGRGSNPMENPILNMTLSLSRKVNLGNYESADVFLCVSGMTAETTQEDIDALLDKQGAMAYRSIATRLKEKVATFNQEEWDRLKANQDAALDKPPLIPVAGGQR